MSIISCNQINYLRKNIGKILVFFTIYLLGIILALFFYGNTSKQSLLQSNAQNYYIIIFNPSSSYLTAFFKCFLAGFFLSFTTLILGLSIYSIPFVSVILFYRGVILGTSFIIFFTLSGISGIVLFIILTLPIHLIITFGLIIASVLNYKCQCVDLKSKIVICSKNAIISILFSLIASLYLIFILITIIRPINLLF